MIRAQTVNQLQRDVVDKTKQLLNFADMSDQAVPEYIYDGAVDSLMLRSPIVADDDRLGCLSDERAQTYHRFDNAVWIGVVEEEARKLFENAIAHRVIRRIDLNSQIDRPKDADGRAVRDGDEKVTLENEVLGACSQASRAFKLRRAAVRQLARD